MTKKEPNMGIDDRELGGRDVDSFSSVLIPLGIIPSFWNPVEEGGGKKSSEERFWL